MTSVGSAFGAKQAAGFAAFDIGGSAPDTPEDRPARGNVSLPTAFSARP